MRPGSPATFAGILIATCALGLFGAAWAARDTGRDARLRSFDAVGRHRVVVRAPQARVNRRRSAGRSAPRPARAVASGRPVRGRRLLGLSPAAAVAGPASATAPAVTPQLVAAAARPTPTPEPAEGPTPAPPPEPAPAPPSSPPTEAPASALYWGASIGSQLTGEQAPWDMTAVTKFEQIAGKEVSLVNFFGPFANCSSTPCSFYLFPTGPMESIRAYGAIPVYSWSSQSIPSRLNEPDFQLADVIAGTYDSYIRKFAEAAKAWGHPFFLRFNWEMNGRWFPWSEGVNGNKPGEFVAAWRHVHDIFTAVGADNATWVWCPNVDPDDVLHDLASLYPGDAYVDWTGLDGYNWGLNPSRPDRWRSFNELYEATYRRIVGTIAPDKPMLIGEMGSTEHGGSKAEWIAEALGAIPTSYPMIRGMLWFDTYDDGMDWPIETSSSSAGAFAQAIQSEAYVSAAATSSAEGPIAPPD